MNKIKFENNLIILSIFLILMAMWILNHPYKGLVHDARLYAIQALSHLEPDVFKNDIFLRYDSQDNYTIFSNIYVSVIKLTNLADANLILFIIGHILWFVSAWLLASLLNSGALKYFAVALVAAMPAYYGGRFIFSYGEPFLTPRIYAEALVLFSIYFALKNRFVLCGLMLLLGFLFHPIMALTGVIFFAFYFLLKYPKSVLVIGSVLGILILIAALAGVAPFDRILQFMDPYWTGIVNQRSPYLFLYDWLFRDFLTIITSFLVIMLYALTNQGMKQAVALSLLTATAVFLLVSVVLGDFLWNVLIMQLQVWRISWLLLFFSYLAFPWVYIKVREQTDLGTSFLIVFGAAWLAPYNSVLTAAYALTAVFSFLIVLGNCRGEGQAPSRYTGFLKDRWSKEFWKKVNLVMTLFPLAFLSYDLADYFHDFYVRNTNIVSIREFPPVYLTYTLPLLMLGAFGLCYQLIKRDKRVILFSLVFFLLAASLWDRRLEYEKIIAGNHGIEQVSIVKNLPIKSELLWFEYPTLAWFVANRANFISHFQGVSALFSRESAVLYDQRMKSMGMFSPWLDYPTEFYWRHQPAKMKMFYENLLTTCCRKTQELNYVVISYNIPKYKPLEIIALKDIRVNYSNRVNFAYKNFDWYLYNCQAVNLYEKSLRSPTASRSIIYQGK
ncbi:MAG: hypothetical protein JXA41_01865 [Deltaproteobacteria bacterium]|nr:hypothetical protein [Deltaproteobacteria bacterium]